MSKEGNLVEELSPMFAKLIGENKCDPELLTTESSSSHNKRILSPQYGSTAISSPIFREKDVNDSLKDGLQNGESPKYSRLRPERQFLRRTGSSFYEDARTFREGSIPQSIIVGLVVGIVCGVSSWAYYCILNYSLKLFWKILPQFFMVDQGVKESLYILWIPIVAFSMAFFVGLSVVFLGDPGDMDYTVQNVHERGYLKIDHMMPMVVASIFSIVGGASVGPEAPLVAICAALGGFVSRNIFKRENKNIIRKHTLMGMSGALSAFFGTCLGGSLFALEINSRFGVEYFEHMIESIFCGQVTLTVFRSLSGMSNGPIWKFNVEPMTESYPNDVYLGVVLGLLGGGIATLFAFLHWKVVDLFKLCGLMEERMAVIRAFVGCLVIVVIGIFFPHTMFWGEEEIQTIVNMDAAETLKNVWPTKGLIGFEISNGFHAFLVGVLKLVAISFSVAGGFRGGFIFPLFACGAAFGRAFCAIYPQFDAPMVCCCLACAINVGITKTPLATPIIIVFLANEPYVITAALVASTVSLFATAYLRFIKSQTIRPLGTFIYEETQSVFNMSMDETDFDRRALFAMSRESENESSRLFFL